MLTSIAVALVSQSNRRPVWMLVTVTATRQGKLATHTELRADPFGPEEAAYEEAEKIVGLPIPRMNAS